MATAHRWSRFSLAQLCGRVSDQRRQASSAFGFLLFLGLLSVLALANDSRAQETPPTKLPEVLEGAIKPDAFYFLDAQGNRVLWPGITLEDIDRWKKAELGYVQQEKTYTIQSLDIQGTADDQSGELTVLAKLNVAATPGRWVEIPLRMEGFHQRGPADVVGVEDYKVDTASDGGVLLWVKTDQPREIELRMRVVCRILAEVGQGLEFRLPAAPTKVSLSVRGDDLSASVVGRGDEVVQTSAGEAGETKVEVECSGGSFVLSWRMRDGRRGSEQVLEVDSRMRVVWTDPQSPASVSVDMDVNNRRGGSLGPFQVVVPEGVELIEPLQSSSVAQLSARDPKTGQIQVTPDDSVQLSRVKVTLEYRLPSGDYRSENPLMLMPAVVQGAVRQGGEIEIRTDRNFRLRWKQHPDVRSAARPNVVDPVDSRVYSFQYDRAAFELPIWLTAKQQRLRVEPEYTIRIGRNSATMEARIVATGTIIEGVPLVVDAAGWQTNAVQDLETGRSVDDPLGDSGEGLELELGELTPSGSSSVGVLWKAARSLGTKPSDTALSDSALEAEGELESNAIRFELPTIRSADDRAVIVSQGSLVIRAESGLALVTNFEGSEGLSRLLAETMTGSGTEDQSDGVLRFRVQSVGAVPVYEGYILERSPESRVDVGVELAADGEVLRILNDWMVTPQGNLQGQMPIVIPGFDSEPTRESGPRGTDWQVRVDGQPAFLRDDGDGRWTLFSERLALVPCRVQLEAIVPLKVSTRNMVPSASQQDSQIDLAGAVAIRLPRPVPTNAAAEQLAATTASSLSASSLGAAIGISANLKVFSPTDMSVMVGDSQRMVDDGEGIDAFSKPVMWVKVERREALEANAQFVSQALLRTEIGRSRRYDRLLARVVGGRPQFVVDFFPATDRSASAGFSERILRVSVDGREVLNFEQKATGLVVPLPTTSQEHLVDIQSWRPRRSNGMAGTARPEMRLPISTGKTYWDVVMATDRHLIWSSPGASELMLWQYENLFVHRAATRSYSDLLSWIGGPPLTETQAGNRYLLVTSDPGSLQICEAGRPLLWLTIGGIVLGSAILLFYLPVFRHPLLLVAAGLAVAGMGWLVPDLAVIAGQLMIAAMLLVAVMLGVRAVLSRRPRATVLGGIPSTSSVHSGNGRRSVESKNGIGSANTGSEKPSLRLPETVTSGNAAGAGAQS